MAIGCAAIDDVTAWCLLALVLAIGRGRALASLSSRVVARGWSWRWSR